MHYTKIGREAKPDSPRVKLLSILLDILSYIIQQQKIIAVIDWKNGVKDTILEKFGARLAIFRDTNKDNDYQIQITGKRKVEATFRMGLKGALHYLFKYETPIIDQIYVDYDDYNFHKTFDETNLWERLKMELRENISYTEASSIIPFSKSEYKLDCPISQAMQFVDNILGSFRNVIMQDFEYKARYLVSEKLRELVNKDYTKYARMKESRFFNAYALTDAYIEDEQWTFQPIKIENDAMQFEIDFGEV